MKLTKSNIEKLRNCQFKILIPRLELPTLHGNGSIKSKKRRTRLSNRSDKENQIIRNRRSCKQPKLNLIKIDEVLQAVRQSNFSHLQLSETDLKLSQAVNRNRNASYKKIDEITIQRLETERNGVKSSSKSVHVSHSASNDLETSRNSDVEVHTVTSSQNECVTRRSKRVFNHSRNVKRIPMTTRNSKKRTFSRMPQTDMQNEQDADTPSSSNTPVNGNNDVEDILRSHSSHSCADKIDQKINNIQLAQTPDGSFVRRDFVIRIQQHCMNKPATVAVPERSTAVVSSTTKRESFSKSAKKTQRGVTVERTIGINLRTRTKSMEKNCTKIVHSKYTETVETCNKKVKLDQPFSIVTRRRAASKTDNEFFSLPNRKNKALFSSNKIEAALLESTLNERTADVSLLNNKTNNSRKRSHTVSEQELEPTQNEEVKIQPPPSCSYTIPSSNITQSCSTTPSSSYTIPLSNITQNCSIELIPALVTVPEKPAEKNVLKEITFNRRESARLAKKSSKKIQSEKEKKHRKENKQKKSINVATNEKPPTTRKSTRSSRNPTLEPSNLPTVDYTTKLGLRTKSIPKRYLSDDQNETRSRKKKNTNKFIPLIELPDDDMELPEERTDNRGRKRMSKKVAQQKAQKFNEHRKSLETSTKKQTRTVPATRSSSSRHNTRKSTKAQNESMTGNSSRHPLNVTFVEATPKTITRKKDKKHVYSSLHTPCSVVLDRLDATDMSIYAITPLREDRARPPPKTPQDYGIDDVNTDDSTDDEDEPKKIPPNWVKSIMRQGEVQFHIPRDMVKNWIRPPKRAFTVKSLFF